MSGDEEMTVTPEERDTVPQDPLDLVLVQTALDDYRQAVLEVMIERLGARFAAYAGPTYFHPSFRTRVQIGSALRPLRNHFLADRRLLWQHGAFRAAWSPSVAIVEFNPRILSVWMVLLARGLRRRRTLLWGHAWSRSGRHARTAPVRAAMRRLASGVIVYSSAQADELASVMPRSQIFVAPNAIYRACDMQPMTAPLQAINTFLFVGRLVPEKKPDRLLRAFRDVQPLMQDGVRLVFVGDGPLRHDLEHQARDLGSAVEFLGHVGDHAALRRIYSRAIASVSPGTVGLSITQSLGFGVPMIISRDERHGPEVVAAVEGWNSLFFRDDVPGDLARALIRMTDERDQWTSRRTEIAALCRSSFSAESMAEGFLEAAGLAAN